MLRRALAAYLGRVRGVLAGWDDRELARRAETASVRVYPMSDYRARAAREPAVVLGYAALTPTEIDAGVQALAGACLRPPPLS